MLRAMYSGITGLRNFQTQMDVVGNNIANVNTVGFKSSRVTFQTTLLQTIKSGKRPDGQLGGTNPMAIGLGSQVASIDKLMGQGSFQNTGKKTDLAIQGDGFFVLSDGEGQFFTRAGNFTLDTSGNLVDPSSGMKLQGWSSKITADGQRYVDSNDPIGDIKVSAGQVMPAKQTSFIKMAHNINADVGIQETTLVTKTGMGTNLPVKFAFSRNMEEDNRDRIVYDFTADLEDLSDRYSFVQEDAGGISSSDELNGMVELDESGNVLNWITYDESGSAASSDKLSIYDIKGSITDPATGTDATFDTTAGADAASFSGNIKISKADGTEAFYDPQNISIDWGDTNADELTVQLEIDGNIETFSFAPTDVNGDGNISINELNQSLSNGVTNANNLTLSGLSVVSASSAETIDGDFTVNVTSTKEIIQPPSGGSIRFTDLQNPSNFSIAEYESPTVSTSSLVYDSLGKDYNVYTKFTKLDNNTWHWKAELDDGTPLKFLAQDGTRDNTRQAEGVIAFDGNGGIAATDWRLRDDGTIDSNSTDNDNGAAGFWFDPSEMGAALNPNSEPSSAAGAGPVQIEIDFNEITQFSSNHSIAVTEQDGNAEGTLESFAINEVGELVGTFTNGSSDTLGKVGMATFNNPQGLMETGNSMYTRSSNSGLAQIGVAGVGGRGTLIPGALEMSNVDLAEEFTNMIVAQRGFQATSRIITTSDQILQELVNIKR
ncbi:MAG: flagellar hook-basal body complex protein [Thermotogota bacterium]